MDEVQWGATADPESTAAGLAHWRTTMARVPVRLTRRIAIALVVVGFLLVLVAQYLPWVTFIPGLSGTDDDNSGPIIPPGTSGVADSGAISTPYYLCWLVALTLCGACLFVADRWRKALFGAATGALVMVTAVMLPVIHQPKRLLTVSTIGLLEVGRDIPIAVHRSGGMVTAVLAVVALAAAMLLAVRSEVPAPPRELLPELLPERRDEAVSPVMVTVDPLSPADHSLYVRPTPIAGDVRKPH